MSDPRAVLDGIARRADVATPGPWEAINGNEPEYFPLWMVTNDEFHNPTGTEDAPWLAAEIHVGTREDAEFIANARDVVPKLVAALRAVLDHVEGMPHDASDEDCWYACAQAKDPYTGEWASCNESRAGGPCDCGRDGFVAKVNRAITEALGGAT